MIMESPYMSIREAADYLKIAVSTLYSEVSRRNVSYYKRGRRVLFTKEDLDAYRKPVRVESNAEVRIQVQSQFKKSA